MYPCGKNYFLNPLSFSRLRILIYHIIIQKHSYKMTLTGWMLLPGMHRSQLSFITSSSGYNCFFKCYRHFVQDLLPLLLLCLPGLHLLPFPLLLQRPTGSNAGIYNDRYIALLNNNFQKIQCPQTFITSYGAPKGITTAVPAFSSLLHNTGSACI